MTFKTASAVIGRNEGELFHGISFQAACGFAFAGWRRITWAAMARTLSRSGGCDIVSNAARKNDMPQRGHGRRWTGLNFFLPAQAFAQVEAAQH